MGDFAAAHFAELATGAIGLFVLVLGYETLRDFLHR